MQTQLIVAAVPNLVSSLEQNNTASLCGIKLLSWQIYAFNIIKNENQKQFLFTGMGSNIHLQSYPRAMLISLSLS